jgi:hypothetical protein
MSEDNPQREIDDASQEADADLGELEDEAAAMGERLEEHESDEDEVEVPEPGHGETLSMSEPEGEDEPGVGEGDVPEDQGEAADAAGQ